MATSFQIFAVRDFPKGRKFQTEEQLTLDLEAENVETAVTKVTRHEGVESTFSEYRVQHDYLFQLQHFGRARGIKFKEFLTPYSFPIFLAPVLPVAGLRPLLVRTKRDVALDFTKRLNRYNSRFEVQTTAIDFVALRPRLERIEGAWFRSIRAPHLASAGVFGPHVDRSAEFQHAEQVGQLTTLMLRIQREELTYSVMVTSGGGIILHDLFQTPEDEAEMAYYLLTTIIDGCIMAKPDPNEGNGRRARNKKQKRDDDTREIWE